jgi:hypothetical protein
VRGTVPPGLRKKDLPLSRWLGAPLGATAANCEHLLVGGHLILLNRTRFLVAEVFH